MKFTLEIELGNEEMRTDVDIRDALHKTAYKARMSSVPEAGDDGAVYDYNGKTVGKWEVTNADPVAAVRLYDADLDAKEQVSTGQDYNRILEILGSRTL